MKKIKFFSCIFLTAVLSSLCTLVALYFAMGLNTQKFSDVARFIRVMRYIEARYVEDVQETKLMDGAISGMVRSLGDPHSMYMEPGVYKKLLEHTSASFGGIGVYMGFRDKKVTVVSVMEGFPAEKAGLKNGDEILAVDGTPVTEIEPEEVAIRIRGPKGTNVVLKVARVNEEPKDYTLTRDNIQVATAKGKMLEGNIGYMRIVSFSENTGKEFNAEYKKLLQEGMKGMIIDLRANPGGLITTCVDVAQKIVPEGVIVSIVERSGKKEEYTSKLKESPLPMVVLIDKGSASASEILAGALKDTKAATLVGEKSYGKGSVQAVVPMFEGDALKLTVAKYYTPKGRSIDGSGIEPDVPVEYVPGERDNQLMKSVEILKQNINNR